MTVAKSIFKSIFKGYGRGFAGGETTGPDQANLLGYYPNSPIVDGKLIARAPASSHTTQQVKSSGFLGAGSATVTGLLTTDTITTTNGNVTDGVELVVNGGFASDTTGWGSLNLAALSIVSGRLRVTNTIASFGKANQAITTIVGGRYKLLLTLYAGTSASANYRVGTTPDGVNLLNVTTATTGVQVVVTFTATTTTSYVCFAGGNVAGQYFEVDNVSIQLLTQAVPTCSANGTLTFPGPDCWDIDVYRDGVLWAYWPGINVGPPVEDPPITNWTELDASGNGHHLTVLTGTTITERVDGTGTMWTNVAGFTVADGTQYFDSDGETLITTGWRISVLLDGSGSVSWSWVFEPLTIDGEILTIDGATLNIGV